MVDAISVPNLLNRILHLHEKLEEVNILAKTRSCHAYRFGAVEDSHSLDF